MTTARRTRVRVGMKFNHVYADGNVEWEVMQRDGARTWICVSSPDDIDWPGIEKAFTSDDILRSVNSSIGWQNRFDECDAWYQAQAPGTLVHYNNGFGNYIRCEVIRLDKDHTMRTGTVYKKGEHALRPIALVGAWRPYDLPRRMRDGSINYPYCAKRVLEGDDIMKPDFKCIFEANREGLEPKHGDPTVLEPIDLSVPGMTPDEQIMAEKWAAIDKIKKIEGDDADAILAQMRQIVLDA